jgi:hypothetical protein
MRTGSEVLEAARLSAERARSDERAMIPPSCVAGRARGLRVELGAATLGLSREGRPPRAPLLIER